MKRLALAAVLALGFGFSLSAQQSSPLLLTSAALPSSPMPASHFNFSLVPELALPSASAAAQPLLVNVPHPDAPALPPGAPTPQGPGVGVDDYYRWDLALGYEFVHFKSAPFDANFSGVHTDLTYNLRDWIGVEGNVISAWGGDVFSGERSKYVLFTGGVRASWGSARRRWSPWGHVLVGGAHVNPQVARESKNGFALQVGGGADYHLRPRLSLRAEGDYVRTQLYSTSQNNFQFGFGAVLHF